jgi:hypothetical protein
MLCASLPVTAELTYDPADQHMSFVLDDTQVYHEPFDTRSGFVPGQYPRHVIQSYKARFGHRWMLLNLFVALYVAALASGAVCRYDSAI